MSDHESNEEKPAANMGIGNLETDPTNLFSYQNRSACSSSSEQQQIDGSKQTHQNICAQTVPESQRTIVHPLANVSQPEPILQQIQSGHWKQPTQSAQAPKQQIIIGLPEPPASIEQPQKVEQDSHDEITLEKQKMEIMELKGISESNGIEGNQAISLEPISSCSAENSEKVEQNLKLSPEQIQTGQKIETKATEEDDRAYEKYEKQLKQDMEILKRQTTKKKKNATAASKKQSDNKARLNKTVMPMAHIQQSEIEDESILEARMIKKMTHEKKKQNYQLLKQWDKQRAEALGLHRNLIEILQNQIDKRIKSSIENLEIYAVFFREKARQEEKYVSYPIINTRFALQNNSLSKNVYINCSVILNSLSDENNVRCRRINDFIYLIRNDIIRDLVESHLGQSQRQLLRIREKISSLKNSLRKYNLETEQKTSELALFFNENALKADMSEKDFFVTQTEFLRKAEQQIEVQKRLGEYCLEYYHTAISQQIKRSKVIREAMITFAKGLKQSYNIDTDPVQIQQLSKAQQNKLIEQFYSLEQIFDERCISVFKSSQGFASSQEITIDNFTEYIKKFHFRGFDSRIILLKSFNVKYIHSKTRTEDCLLVITVDKFIHMFFSKQKTEQYAKPDVSLRIGQKDLEFKPVKSEILELVLKDDRRNSMMSYFWESKNDKIYIIQFQKKDNREEFLDYVIQLKC